MQQINEEERFPSTNRSAHLEDIIDHPMIFPVSELITLDQEWESSFEPKLIVKKSPLKKVEIVWKPTVRSINDPVKLLPPMVIKNPMDMFQNKNLNKPDKI